MKKIPYSRQHIDAADIKLVEETLNSDFVTQGPKVQEFETRLADYCGAKYAVAVANGTAALHLAALASGLKKGDEAITTPISFLATSNSIIYAGATPVFTDIDYNTINIDPEQIIKSINKKTKALFPVDFAGLPTDMEKISKIGRKRGLMIVEDASHALGAKYKSGFKVGSCKYSDMTVFSFHPVKHITTGEGGAIITNDKKLHETLKGLRSHGVYKRKGSLKKQGGWYYEMEHLGFNYRITDIQCALGIGQLNKLDEFVRRRRQIAQKYNDAFKAFGSILKIPNQKIGAEKHSWHLYVLRVNTKNSAKVRRALYDHLLSQGIYAQVHYIPIYQQPFYRTFLNGKKISCPNAEKYYEEALSIPIFPQLTDSEFDQTVTTIKKFLTKKLK